MNFSRFLGFPSLLFFFGPCFLGISLRGLFAGGGDSEAPGEAYRVLKLGGFVEDG